MYLNGESGSPVDYGCELEKYGSLARTIDQTPSGLSDDKIQLATLFPSATAADGVCTNFASGNTDASLIHIAEGLDQSSRNEFTMLGTITNPDNCLYSPKTAIVHGTSGDAVMVYGEANATEFTRLLPGYPYASWEKAVQGTVALFPEKEGAEAIAEAGRRMVVATIEDSVNAAPLSVGPWPSISPARRARTSRPLPDWPR